VFNGPFTYRNIAKGTDVKGYESIDIHDDRNTKDQLNLVDVKKYEYCFFLPWTTEYISAP
jgi:hypothetical protein